MKKNSPQIRINKVLATNNIDAIISRTPRNSFNNTAITHKSKSPNKVKEVNSSDVSSDDHNHLISKAVVFRNAKSVGQSVI